MLYCGDRTGRGLRVQDRQGTDCELDEIAPAGASPKPAAVPTLCVRRVRAVCVPPPPPPGPGGQPFGESAAEVSGGAEAEWGLRASACGVGVGVGGGKVSERFRIPVLR